MWGLGQLFLSLETQFLHSRSKNTYDLPHRSVAEITWSQVWKYALYFGRCYIQMLTITLLTWKFTFLESNRTKPWPFSLQPVTGTMSLIIKENAVCVGQVCRRDYLSHNDESGFQDYHPHYPPFSHMLPNRKWLSRFIVQVTVNSHTFNISSNLVLLPAFRHIGKESLFIT